LCVLYSRIPSYRDLRRLATLVFIVFLLFQVNSRNTVNLLHFLFEGHALVQLVEAQAGRSQVQFLMVSLEFFIDIILPGLWPCG